MIYLDSSVALAHLLVEDRVPPSALWAEPLVSSRLLECEVWTRIHARRLGPFKSAQDAPDGIDGVLRLRLAQGILLGLLGGAPQDTPEGEPTSRRP